MLNFFSQAGCLRREVAAMLKGDGFYDNVSRELKLDV